MADGRTQSGKPRLASPASEFHASYLAALGEFHNEGSHPELDIATLADAADFARYVEALRADVKTPGEAVRYVAALRGAEPETWPGGYVPQTILWWVAGEEYLGRVNIRHRLTESLRHEGGNIGYVVRPGARRRGHATAMLAAALPVAAGLGIESALLDCEADNVASRRVIEKNGGRLERREGESLYFLVPTGRTDDPGG